MQPSPLELIDDVRLTLDKVYQRIVQQPDSLDRQIIWQLAEQLQESVEKAPFVSLASTQHRTQDLGYCAQHAVDVGILACLMLQRMKYAQTQSVVAAALSMNMSYISLFNQFVFSQPRLNAIQKQDRDNHPRQAHQMLVNAGVNDKIWLECVLYHHEMMDGSGYPEQIKDKQIPPMARLLAACDYYCSSVHSKKFADGKPYNQVLIELFGHSSKQYDAKLAPLFYSSLAVLPAGSLVELENSQKALVISRPSKKTEYLFKACLLDDKSKVTDKFIPVNPKQIKQVLSLPYHLKIPVYETWGFPLPQQQSFTSSRIHGRPPSKNELVQTRRIIQASDLPIMPEIVAEVQAEMEKKEPDISLVSHLIGSDVAMSALILKTVTKLVSHSSPIQSIPHAITILGIDRLSQVVKTAALTLTFKDLDEKLLNYWEDAQTTALAAARIAEDLSDIDPEEAYMAGLFQSAGCLLLSIKFPDYFDKTFDKAIKEPFSFLEFEQQEYGTDRGLVSYMLCHEWALPESIKLATYYRYIENFSQIENIKIRTITAVISLASYITDLINKFSIEPNEEQLSLLQKTLDELMLEADEVEKMKNEIMIEMKN